MVSRSNIPNLISPGLQSPNRRKIKKRTYNKRKKRTKNPISSKIHKGSFTQWVKNNRSKW